MPDFTKLYSRPAGEGKKPPQWLPGDYPGLIKSLEHVQSREKKTPGMQYHLIVTDWFEGAPERWTETDEQGKVWEYQRDEVDLSKKQVSFTFYFPVDPETGEPLGTTDFMYDDFLRSCGVEPEGQSYADLMDQVVGKEVLIEMRGQLNESTNRIFVRANRIVGLANSR